MSKTEVVLMAVVIPVGETVAMDKAVNPKPTKEETFIILDKEIIMMT